MFNLMILSIVTIVVVAIWRLPDIMEQWRHLKEKDKGE